MGLETLEPYIEEIRRIAARNGGTNLRVFGSFARGDARPDSDLDILLDMQQGRTLLDVIAIKQDIEDLLGRKVDVVTEGALSHYIRPIVFEEAVRL